MLFGRSFDHQHRLIGLDELERADPQFGVPDFGTFEAHADEPGPRVLDVHGHHLVLWTLRV